MRFKSASPRFGSTSVPSFLGALTMSETSREHLDLMSLALGRLIISCSFMEHALTMTVAGIMDLNEVQERALVRPMATSTKISLLNRIAKDYLKKAEQQRQVAKVLARIKKASEERNDLVHGLYVHDRDDGKVAIISFSEGSRLRGNPVRWEPKDLEYLRLEMVHLCDELDALKPLFPKIEKAPQIPQSASIRGRGKQK